MDEDEATIKYGEALNDGSVDSSMEESKKSSELGKNLGHSASNRLM